MVLPTPAIDDAPDSDPEDWIERLTFILGLTARGVIVLIDQARPERLGDLVRGLRRVRPDVEVHCDALRAVSSSEGALVVLVPDPAQADWLNRKRPLFERRELRLILFSSAETSIALARQAPDFFHWISHRIECPGGPAPYAVRGLRAALRARTPLVAWTQGDLDAAFAVALPRRQLMQHSAAQPYGSLVLDARLAGRDWLAWTHVDSPLRLRRVRWALAEAGRRGRTLLVMPAAPLGPMWKVHAAALPIAQAVERLERAGAASPGRLAALVDLEPEAVELAAELLHSGESDAALERLAAQDADPGAVLAREAMKRALLVDHASPPWLRAFGQPREADPIGKWLRARAQDESAWPSLLDAALLAEDPQVAVRWAEQWIAANGHQAATLRGLSRALDLAGRPLDAAKVRRDADLPLERDVSATTPTLLQDAERELGGDHPAVARLLRASVAALRAAGDHAQAEAVLQRALAIDENALGTEHPVLAESLQMLASLLSRQGHFAEAEATLRRAIQVRVKALGENHRSLAPLHHDLAGVLGAQGRFAEANAQQQRASAAAEPQDMAVPELVAAVAGKRPAH